jgi:AsmA protein
VTASQGSAQLPHPAGGETPLTVSFVGDAQLEPVARSASGALAGHFDRSRLEGSWRFEAGAAPPLGVALSIDRLTLDRYLPPARAASDPADLAAWRNWPVEADLRVGELRFRGLVSENARLQLSGGPGPSSAR